MCWIIVGSAGAMCSIDAVQWLVMLLGSRRHSFQLLPWWLQGKHQNYSVQVTKYSAGNMPSHASDWPPRRLPDIVPRCQGRTRALCFPAAPDTEWPHSEELKDFIANDSSSLTDFMCCWMQVTPGWFTQRWETPYITYRFRATRLCWVQGSAVFSLLLHIISSHLVCKHSENLGSWDLLDQCCYKPTYLINTMKAITIMNKLNNNRKAQPCVVFCN